MKATVEMKLATINKKIIKLNAMKKTSGRRGLLTTEIYNDLRKLQIPEGKNLCKHHQDGTYSLTDAYTGVHVNCFFAVGQYVR